MRVDLRRYEKDPRSIPGTGEGTSLAGIGGQASFTMAEDKLQLQDPENGSQNVPIGAHLQYIVATAQ